MKKAYFQTKEKHGIRCLLCPKYCLLKEGQTGICGARKVINGELCAINYGFCSAINFDPIEKKPLYHFHPGEEVLSLGTCGCNFKCLFCQNWPLSRGKIDNKHQVTPLQVLKIIQDNKKFPGVAFTYNEPTIWYEFVYDTAKILHHHNLKTILISNGYINTEPLKKLLPYISAANIDLKGFSNSFYRKYCQGEVDQVLKTIKTLAGQCHLEITCLIIPTANDDPQKLKEMFQWIASIDPDMPVHIPRYFPAHKLDYPPTSISQLQQIKELASKELSCVYIRNAKL